MVARQIIAFCILLSAAPVLAAGCGLLDYTLPIAPGFSVARMNSFQVCLEGPPEGLLLVCPEGEVGPIAEYALTDAAIVLRNFGAKPVEGPTAMGLQTDLQREFFFYVRRSDQHITGPLTREEWDATELPRLSSLSWVQPRNPIFSPPPGEEPRWPFLLLCLLAAAASWLVWRQRSTARPAA
jgi:hypothetical protein